MRKQARKPRRKKFIASAVALVAGLAMAFYGIYDVAKKAGFAEGDTVGYQRGQDFGFRAGRENGYAEWYQPRYNNGYRDGYENGMIVGYENGYDDGFKEGLAHMRVHGYPIRDPTRQEMIDFLAGDKTDENEYIENVYVCRHFATDLCNNAERAGYRCAFVSVTFPEGGHTLVAFNVIGEGLIFIEPQRDEEVEIEVGKPYEGYTVTEILIAW